MAGNILTFNFMQPLREPFDIFSLDYIKAFVTHNDNIVNVSNGNSYKLQNKH